MREKLAIICELVHDYRKEGEREAMCIYLTESKLRVPELVYFFFFFFSSGLMRSRVRTSPPFSGVISRREVVHDPI